VVSCNIGLIVLLIALAGEAADREHRLGIAVLLIFLAAAFHHSDGALVRGLNALAHPSHVHAQLEARFNDLEWVKMIHESPLPIVTDDSELHAWLDYYANPGLSNRLVSVIDLQEIKTYPDSATNQLNSLYFSPIFSFHETSARQFLEFNRHFLTVEKKQRIGKMDWFLPALYDWHLIRHASQICANRDLSGEQVVLFDVLTQ